MLYGLTQGFLLNFYRVFLFLKNEASFFQHTEGSVLPSFFSFLFPFWPKTQTTISKSWNSERHNGRGRKWTRRGIFGAGLNVGGN